MTTVYNQSELSILESLSAGVWVIAEVLSYLVAARLAGGVQVF